MDKQENKTEQKKMSFGTKIAILAGVLLIIVLAIFAVWKMQDKPQSYPVSSGEITDIEMLEIETSYGIMEYPPAFTDVLKYEEKTEGDVTEVSFQTTVFGDPVPLFTIYFQKPDSGVQVGYLKKDGKEIPITIEVFDNEPADGATENQKEKYYQMIDGVNDIIASIATFDGYVEK